jgi:lysophospholipase L1-like esterase
MTGTWTTAYLAALASADDMLPFFPPPRRFGGQTVRQRVRLRRGGNAARLVLSNEFGRAPLVIDAVAVSDGDFTSTVPALRQGAGRWEIPPGAVETSDPLPLPTTASAELIVDCLDWIARVLVDQPASGPVVVALGDSITRGDGTTLDLDQRYPDHLQRRLLDAGIDGVVLNAGIGGNRLLRPVVGPSMTERFDRDVLGVGEATHVLILAGTNDIALPSMLGERRPAADEIIDGLRALACRAARHGVQPLLGTITPFGGSSIGAFLADGNEDIRRAVNDAITGQADWPVVDFAAALADPDDPGRLASDFGSGDGVHPGDAGARALAVAVDLALFK